MLNLDSTVVVAAVVFVKLAVDLFFGIQSKPLLFKNTLI